MLDSTGRLSIAELVVYLLLLPLAVCCLFRHGKYGILGWIYLVAFCVLRMVGAALLINSENKGTVSTTALIINGVALSPLLLSTAGILHESNHYIKGRRPFVLRIIIVIALHLVISGAIGLVVSGSIYNSDHQTNPTLAKIGSIIFVIVWVTLFSLTLISWRQARETADATRLLYAVTAILPFLGVRVIYSLVSRFNTALSSTTGPLAVRVVLGTLMEFIIVIVFVVAGLMTRHIACRAPMAAEGPVLLDSMPSSRNQQHKRTAGYALEEQRTRP